MNESDRPNPDALLAAIQSETARGKRGKVKVFLGMSPGVGKTYAMLEAAQRELKSGRDVVIGYVETHGRKETDALTAGLPIVPRKAIEHRGITLTEMDLDAVLARRPQLALVDELAHTNAPGSRHPKRWQDVRELLDAGIDVFTTVNVQHVESRADTVRQITGAEIRETVPDSVLDAAETRTRGSAARGITRASGTGKSLCARSRCCSRRKFFPGSKSHRAARTRIAPGRGSRRRGNARSFIGRKPLRAHGRRGIACLSPSVPARFPNRSSAGRGAWLTV